MKHLHALIFLLSGLLFACGTDSTTQDSSRTNFTDEAFLQEGKQLSAKYCGNCHQYPEPKLLDKATWRNVILPRMGNLMGIYAGEREAILQNILEDGPGRNVVEAANIFPKEPLIPSEDWQKITAFYLNKAPESLTLPATTLPDTTLKTFRLKTPEYYLSPPSTTLVHINEDKTFYIGDANKQSLFHFDANLKLLNAAQVSEGAVSLSDTPDNLRLTVMGSFSPTDEPKGFVFNLPKNKNEKPTILASSLKRPVHTSFGDLNQDGQEDILVAEFGKWTGGLSLWENQNGSFSRRYLRKTPGAIKTVIQDMNNDELPDIVALFGQGDEGVFLYTNLGEGKFRESRLLSFPSSYGSSSMELLDYNQDGHLDIVYTCGDNADYTSIPKPYHGMYVFLNDGQNQFTQDFFYHLPGAYKAIYQDFDEDGDQDFAVISFFPNYREESATSFIFLENQGDGTFLPQTFSKANAGRWISMDAGDLDGDGDVDLILGSLAFEVVPKNGLLKQWVNQGVPFVVLENTTR